MCVWFLSFSSIKQRRKFHSKEKKAGGISVYVLLEKDTDSLKLLMTVRDLGRGKEVRELVTHLEAVMG